MAQPTTSTAQPTLLFIPDISGFTQFVHETEITHSQHIIQELLEILIDANEINLIISEIEGDAILFYREGKPPTAVELLSQVQRMYVRFHAHLKKYESHRICQCGACSRANNLKLKFIVHYGQISKNRVKEYSKLFGKDVIVAHRLLKNEISHQEYVLLTHQLINFCASWVELEQVAWAPPEPGESHYDFGKAQYCYITLLPLMMHVPEPAIEEYSLSGATRKMLEYETVIEAPIDMVFNVLSDLSVRHQWLVSLKRSDTLNSKIARNGSTHRCVIKEDESDPFFVSHNFQVGKDLITFTETNQKEGYCTVFTLLRIGREATRLQKHDFLKQHWLKELFFNLFMKKKLAQLTKASCIRLNTYCKELVKEGKQHPAGILLEPEAV
jgi:uncharacterized protein YndB with AHSA1/START domain